MSSEEWEPTQASLRDGEVPDRDSHAARNAAQLEMYKREQEKSKLEDLIKTHEDVNWGKVPGMTAAEASVWAQKLAEAADELEGGTI